jgi:nucleotide-binding universal stress UspA family protein
MLVGRDRECALVDRLLERARAGAAGVLLVVGEAGMGKTALLDYAAERGDGMTVVRAVGTSRFRRPTARPTRRSGPPSS